MATPRHGWLPHKWQHHNVFHPAGCTETRFVRVRRGLGSLAW